MGLYVLPLGVVGTGQTESMPKVQVTAGQNDLATTHPKIASEWHPTLNGDLAPCEVTYGSTRSVWWVCSSDSRHVWEAVITNRSHGRGCPVCSNALVLPGVNDLATSHPEIASQWDSVANAPHRPEDVSAGSSRKFSWLCENGHSWATSVHRRTTGRACHYCTNQRVAVGENDLATVAPEISKTWDYTKNGTTTPADVVARSNKKYWWTCSKSHEYLASPSSRLRGTGCPYCSSTKLLKGFNDLGTLHPEIAKLWDYNANGELTPLDVLGGSGKRYHWRCELGHPFVKTADGLKKSNCPVCSNYLVIAGTNDLATTNPALLEEWDYRKNSLLPTTIPPGSHIKIWWKCVEGHSWQATAVSRTAHLMTGCPSCAESGYDVNRTGLFYYIRNSELGCGKVGITNPGRGVDRLSRWEKAGWKTLRKIEYADGRLARRLEQQLLNWIRLDLGLGPHLGPGDTKFGGWTETFSDALANEAMVLTRIELEAETLGMN